MGTELEVSACWAASQPHPADPPDLCISSWGASTSHMGVIREMTVQAEASSAHGSRGACVLGKTGGGGWECDITGLGLPGAWACSVDSEW